MKKRTSLLLIFVITLFFCAAVIFQYSSFRDVEINLKRNIDIDKRVLHLSTLKSNLGYGGIIHLFKNYLLRQDEKYFEKGVSAFANFNSALADYRQLHGITNEELENLAIVEQTMDQYKSELYHAKELFSQNLSIKEVDALVKIDDSAAFQAFDEIDSALYQIRISGIEDSQNILRSAEINLLIIFVIFMIFIAMSLTLFSASLFSQEASAALHPLK